MRPSTEEFLYFLLWSADTIINPTWRNLSDGFETWAWRNGLGRRIAELERQKLLESIPGLNCRRVVRLTESGWKVAVGGRDPIECWNRDWDGRWRMVVFDIPEIKSALRVQLWRHLRRHRFGYLQNSVWITPDNLEAAKQVISSEVANAEALVLFEGIPCGGESNADVVTGAWDFDEINRRYENCLGHFNNAPHSMDGDGLRAWARCERTLWRKAVELDPFLPRALHPKRYLGEKAWRVRRKILQRLAVLGGAARV